LPGARLRSILDVAIRSDAAMLRALRVCLLLISCLALEPALAASSWPRAPGTNLRVVVWNVSREQFFEQRAGFVRALRAIDADLLILDEMSANRSSADLARMLREVYPDKRRAWHVAYGTSGYNQRTVFALRGRLTPLPQFGFLPYPSDYLASVQSLPMTPQEQQRMQRSLAGGIASFGVEARIGSRRLLLVGVDLECCGDSDDAWEEQRRHVESREIRKALEQGWSERHPDAVIVAGDFNAVRGLRPVELLQSGATGAAPELSVAGAMHANRTDNWTWDGRGTPFPSRPIDFVLHDAHLRMLDAWVFDPETMSQTQRKRIGLGRLSLLKLSSLRPVVVDFAWQ
jgi:endonuclease/exonuclease/phosphatase (EEP) superfamily protein YafD